MRGGVETPRGTRAMLVTPPGRGAVASIVVTGAEAAARVGEIFIAASGISLVDAPLGRIVFGRWGAATGEEVVICRVADDEVEIHCHGGDAASGRILRDLEARGVLIGDWLATLAEEFSDSIRSEALIALTQAATARTAAILWEQYRGALLREIEAIDAAIATRDIEAARALVRGLLSRAALGLKLTEPWRVAIVGRPNVGKSSLLNALLGYGRAIVHERPGTTRDLVTGLTACDGWPCQLIDTAGLRETEEPIERAGVGLVAEVLREADLALWVRDATAPEEADEELRGAIPAAALVVWNKCDLVTGVPAEPGVCTSALTGAGMEALVLAIAGRVVASPPAPGEGVPFTVGQVERLRRVDGLLTAGEVVEAAGVMAEWLGAQRHGTLPGEICEPS